MPVLHQLRVIGPGGANRAMEAEVKRLAPRALGRRVPEPKRADTQTLIYPFEADFASFTVNYLRTPTRVIWDLFECESKRLEPLFDEVKTWIESARPEWLQSFPGRPTKLSVKVSEPCEFAASGLQVRGTIKNAIIEGARVHGIELEMDGETPDLELMVRGKQLPLVIGIDLAGESMHGRGWRTEDGQAPLKENLAAEMLMLARWDSRKEMLLDPLAGAGTIGIEGALGGLGAPVWAEQKIPALDRMPYFEKFAAAAKPNLFPDSVPAIISNEIHTPLIDIMMRNAQRAGVQDRILALHGDVRDLDPGRLEREIYRKKPERWPDLPDLEHGLIIANPPYGERLESGRGKDDSLEDLYASLVELHRRLGSGWRAAYLIANPALEAAYGSKPTMKKPMWNGPIRCDFLVWDTPPTPPKKKK